MKTIKQLLNKLFTIDCTKKPNNNTFINTYSTIVGI